MSRTPAAPDFTVQHSSSVVVVRGRHTQGCWVLVFWLMCATGIASLVWEGPVGESMRRTDSSIGRGLDGLEPDRLVAFAVGLVVTVALAPWVKFDVRADVSTVRVRWTYLGFVYRRCRVPTDRVQFRPNDEWDPWDGGYIGPEGVCAVYDRHEPLDRFIGSRANAGALATLLNGAVADVLSSDPESHRASRS